MGSPTNNFLTLFDFRAGVGRHWERERRGRIPEAAKREPRGKRLIARPWFCDAGPSVDTRCATSGVLEVQMQRPSQVLENIG